MATVLLENPVGSAVFSSPDDLQKKLGQMFGTAKKVSTTQDKVQPVSFTKVDDLQGKTLYLVWGGPGIVDYLCRVENKILQVQVFICSCFRFER